MEKEVHILWSSILTNFFVKHNLDMMYVAKNIYHCLIETIFNVQNKTKDRIKAILYLVEIAI